MCHSVLPTLFGKAVEHGARRQLAADAGSRFSELLRTGLEEHSRIKLIAAVALGLQGAEEAGLLEFFKRFLGQPPQLLDMWGTLAYGGE